MVFCKGFVDVDSFSPSIFILAAGLSFKRVVGLCFSGSRMFTWARGVWLSQWVGGLQVGLKDKV